MFNCFLILYLVIITLILIGDRLLTISLQRLQIEANNLSMIFEIRRMNINNSIYSHAYDELKIHTTTKLLIIFKHVVLYEKSLYV
jgi:hypothetical protein